MPVAKNRLYKKKKRTDYYLYQKSSHKVVFYTNNHKISLNTVAQQHRLCITFILRTMGMQVKGFYRE